MTSTLSLRAQVLSGYRSLLKLRSRVFAEDAMAATAAKVKIREEFEANKGVQDEKAIKALIGGIKEVEDLLSINIVQGRLNDRGNYEVKLTPEDLQGKEHEMVTHVDDRLTGQSPPVVERTKAKGKGSEDSQNS